MRTTDESVTRSPSVLMIDGREYALYQGFRERTKLVDLKLLWLDAAKNLALVLYVALMMIGLMHPQFSLWFVFGALSFALAYAALVLYMDRHSVAVVPVSVVEKDRQGRSSTLFAFVRSIRTFSTRGNSRLTATVQTDMADFLLTAIGPDGARGRRSLPRIPTELRNPKVRWFVWGSYANSFTALAVLVVALVVLVTR